MPMPIPRRHAVEEAAGSAVSIAAVSSAVKWTGGQYAAPAAMMGKLYFTAYDGINYTCSATVTASESKSVIFTAAHCLHGGFYGGYSTNLVFYPAIKDGFQSNYGSWAGKRIEVPLGWRTNRYPELDFGAVVLWANSSGQTIQSRTGALGITWNQPKNVYAWAFGYPGVAPFNGNNLYYCNGNTSTAFGNTSVLWIYCNMTQGASGGAWLYNFNSSTGMGLLNGVTSDILVCCGWPTIYSPWFGPTAGAVYNAVRYG